MATPKFLFDKQFSYEPEPATIRGQDLERNTVSMIDLFMQLPFRKKFSPALPLVPLKIPKLVPYLSKDFDLLDSTLLFLLTCHTKAFAFALSWLLLHIKEERILLDRLSFFQLVSVSPNSTPLSFSSSHKAGFLPFPVFPLCSYTLECSLPKIVLL